MVIDIRASEGGRACKGGRMKGGESEAGPSYLSVGGGSSFHILFFPFLAYILPPSLGVYYLYLSHAVVHLFIYSIQVTHFIYLSI